MIVLYSSSSIYIILYFIHRRFNFFDSVRGFFFIDIFILLLHDLIWICFTFFCFYWHFFVERFFFLRFDFIVIIRILVIIGILFVFLLFMSFFIIINFCWRFILNFDIFID